jgi:hypothetical protein
MFVCVYEYPGEEEQDAYAIYSTCLYVLVHMILLHTHTHAHSHIRDARYIYKHEHVHTYIYVNTHAVYLC